MKKSMAPVLVIALLALGSAVILGTSGNQGVPSAKSSVAWTDVAYDGSATGGWIDVQPLSCVIKTSNVSDLVISVNAECALVTDVKIKGTGQAESSTSLADIKVRSWWTTEMGSGPLPYRAAKTGSRSRPGG